MACRKNMAETIMQATVEATKVVIMVVTEIKIHVNPTGWVLTMTKPSGLVLKQPIFDSISPDKYLGHCNFEVEVKNISWKYSYNIQESEKVSIIINWPGCEGLKFIQTLNNTQQENYRTNACLFDVFSEKLKSQHNKTILLL